ncbi:MAG: hypothetical protein RR844_07430 [Clostridium sp.]
MILLSPMIAYKRYYSEVKDDSQLDFYDIHEDEDDDYDYIYTDSYGQRCKHKCSCKENKHHDKKCKKEMSEKEADETSDSKEDYNDDKEFIFIKSQNKKNDGKINCDSYGKSKDNDEDDYTEKMKIKMKGYQILNECDLSDKDEKKKEEECVCKNQIFKDRYEGERRRIENRDSAKKKIVCNDCTAAKDNCNSCEYLIYDMYLNNCDYGYKNHDDKKKNKHKHHDEDKNEKKKSKHKHH